MTRSLQLVVYKLCEAKNTGTHVNGRTGGRRWCMSLSGPRQNINFLNVFQFLRGEFTDNFVCEKSKRGHCCLNLITFGAKLCRKKTLNYNWFSHIYTWVKKRKVELITIFKTTFTMTWRQHKLVTACYVLITWNEIINDGFYQKSTRQMTKVWMINLPTC